MALASLRELGQQERRARYSRAQCQLLNADCTSGPPGGSATGGHVTITEATASSICGTFELTFEVVTSKSTENDTITGSFVSPICAGASEAMSAAEHITCQ